MDRLEKILRDVMNFSRDARFHFERRPLKATVMDAVSVYSAVCDEYSIKVELSFDTERTVLMDSGQAMEAVKNLISNAIDAMPEGGTLRVQTTEEELKYKPTEADEEKFFLMYHLNWSPDEVDTQIQLPDNVMAVLNIYGEDITPPGRDITVSSPIYLEIKP